MFFRHAVSRSLADRIPFMYPYNTIFRSCLGVAVFLGIRSYVLYRAESFMSSTHASKRRTGSSSAIRCSFVSGNVTDSKEMMSYNFLVIFFVSQLKFYTKPRTFYSPGFHFFVEKEPLLIATALFLMNFLIIDLFADKQAACKNS